MIKEFNVDWIAECDQLNVAHIARKKRSVLSLEDEGVIGDESEGGDCDEVICAGWGESGGQWTEWG